MDDDTTTAQVRAIVAAHLRCEGPLLPILHDVQAALGYVPAGAVPVIAADLNLGRAEVQGVVSFYHDFRAAPPGRHVVRLCRAEACQALGAASVARAVQAHFGIGFGETTLDGAVTLEAVYCLGLCACAPAAMVDGAVMGRVEAARIVAAVAQEGA